MKRVIPLVVLLGELLGARPLPADEIKMEQVTALAKTYFRDSAEIPMDVAVTTTVTDKAGRPKQKAQGTVHMIFSGYNQQADRFTVHANSGIFSYGALRDSMTGNMAVFVAAIFLAPGPGKGGLLARCDPLHYRYRGRKGFRRRTRRQWRLRPAG